MKFLKVFLLKHNKFITLLAVIMNFPQIYFFFVYIFKNIFENYPNLNSFENVIAIPMLMITFWLIDLGYYVFLIYIFLVVTTLLTSFVLFFLRKDKNIFKYWTFYYLFISFLVTTHLIFFVVKKGPYFSVITPKDGYEYQIVDYPKGLRNLYKTLAIYTESKAEKYEILGWLDENNLIYKRWERWRYNWSAEPETIGPEKILKYDFISKTSTSFDLKNTNLYIKFCDSKDCLKGIVEEKGYITGCNKLFVSASNDKLACIAQHLYGPEDIVIFKK